MKEMFPEYDDRTDADYVTIWNEALFVFDTNVLLNLYRYQAATSEQLLSVLDKLQARIWIPYQVALEYQRSRRTVIAAQLETLSGVRKAIQAISSAFRSEVERLNLKKRHYPVDLEELANDISKLTTDYLQKLDGINAERPNLNGKDNIKQRLDQLFEKRVGLPPSDEKSLNEQQLKVENRFKARIPPGYKDENKDDRNSGSDSFTHRGLSYKSKHGDALLWQQILDYSKLKDQKTVIFVTDDAKEDWWLKFKVDGGKTIGPRPELIEEAHRVGGIEHFYMYSSDSFLERAAQFLEIETQVSHEMVAEVRDLSEQSLSAGQHHGDDLRVAVRRWLAMFNDQLYENRAFDIETESEEGRAGYEIYTRAKGIRLSSTWHGLMEWGAKIAIEYELTEFNFIYPIQSDAEIVTALQQIAEISSQVNKFKNINIIFGTLHSTIDGPLFKMRSKNPISMIGN